MGIQTFSFFESERNVFKKKEKLSPSQMAEKYRIVNIGSHKGDWENSLTPYLVEIMDTFAKDNIREIVILKGVQTGGTEAALNCLVYEAIRTSDSALFVMADEKTVKRTLKKRIISLFLSSPYYSKFINEDDIGYSGITLNNGFTINIGWATSQAILASDPHRIVILDEIDKYPDANNIAEAKARTTVFPYTKKILILSTPGLEKGPIMQEWNDCDEHYDFYVQCPECKQFQKMVWENFYWENVEYKIIRKKKLAWYKCNSCGTLWDDNTKNIAVRNGEWRGRNNFINPSKVGFHLPGWLSPFSSISTIVAERLRAEQSKDPEIIRSWYNNIAAEPYIQENTERKENSIYILKDDRPRGIVPRDIQMLVMIVDTQQSGFFYEVKAYGWGINLDIWQIREGYVETFQDLIEIFQEDYFDIDGNVYKVSCAFIDSGGGTGTIPKHSRTVEVYEFCRKYPFFKPIKGRQTMSRHWDISTIDFYPGTNQKLPGGLKLYTINVTYYKNYLDAKLKININDPGAIHFHSEISEDYAKQMCAEYRDERGFWKCPKGRANHFWDINVYALAVVDILNLKFKKKTEITPNIPYIQPNKNNINNINKIRRW